MTIERHINDYGTSGCYKCVGRAASWKITLSVSEEYNIDTGSLTVKLCDDCAKLNETQLRIFFLG